MPPSPRHDADIEKDKCRMYEFFTQAGLPSSGILRRWSSNTTMATELRSGAAFDAAQRWPVFLKACHLTAVHSPHRAVPPAKCRTHKYLDWILAEGCHTMPSV